MYQRSVQGRFTSGVALTSVLLALLATATATPAEARHRHHGHAVHHASHAHGRGHHTPKAHASKVPGTATAAIVIDGATGRTLFSMNENAPRHPASITKVMTLYLLFEQLEKGRFTLDSEIPVSAHAASMAPSKLGLRPGQTIRVEDAIKVIVTKSANDIAVAVAEAVGGTESDFAELMTRKAHSLGMNHTLYRNASGLPNNEQITTAYDLSLLGRNIQERFPRYYRYFSLHEFAYNGQRIHTHNHLMDRCEGMDGIKTGYTAASGFNLLSSVKRDGHYIVSVVMGGKSAPSRDNYMEALIERHIDEAGAPGARVASQEDNTASQDEEASNERERSDREQAAQAERAQQERQARAQQEHNAKAQQEKLAKAEPARQPQNLHAADNAPQLQLAAVIPEARMRATPAVAHSAVDDEEDPVPTAAIQPKHPTTAEVAAAHAPAPVARKIALRIPPPEPKSEIKSEIKPAMAKTVQAKSAAPAKPEKVEAKAEAKHAVIAEAKPNVSGWMIQIGATDAADKASELLTRAKSEQHAALASAHPFTEKVTKGKSTLYRARFAGLAENNAEAACKALKRSGFSCIAMRN